ncbi:hypothetical protein [Janthinobacterium aquaticum]|uniref:hypothetical protein n=1 Tax=Janthinobacterium sp. FT58W TaxID=2654254 RepID=UPI0012646C27|nr:hypothetical protein [Janthinobacterium sp. FT58W]KAB8043463.1 hypothetical protein GCM43_09130 [Janthinobacterium sp. FT58W]
MEELNEFEIDAVNGGVLINPWTVMIAYRGAVMVAPYIRLGIYAAASTSAGIFGYEYATS